MATHDYVIDNSTGANVRADINLVLQAILTNNSSSSAPSTTAAYMWWADTTNGVLKIRNSSDNAWVELLQLDGTLTLEDGSASTPGLAFRDDLNTGIFSSAADTFNVATGGVERMELGATTIFNEDGADVDFRIEGDTEANLFYVDAGNNHIGINDSTPSVTLDITGESGGNGEVNVKRTSGATCFIQAQSATAVFGSSSNHMMQLKSNGITALTIDTSQKIGIGTTTPEVMLDIRANDPGIQLVDTGGTSTYGNIDFVGDTLLLTSRGGSSSDGGIDFRGYDGSTIDTNMRILADGNVQIPNDSKELQIGASQDFRLFHDGSSNKIIAQNGELLVQCETYSIRSENGGTIYATIDVSGNLLIGTTSTLNSGRAIIDFTGGGRGLGIKAPSNANGSQCLHFYAGTTQVGNVNVTTSQTNFDTGSDYRLKENAVPISDGITRLKTLKPYRFNFKVEPDKTVDGFFAHEVTAVPEAVRGTKDEVDSDNNPVYQTMDYSKITTLITAALQEAIAKIETLETKVAALEAA